MATKKKSTNFISYELNKLNMYIDQLHDYLDKNPPNLMVDRVEYVDLPRGGQSMKVIATKEDQLKAFTSILEKLPKMLEEVNRLRKSVDEEKTETSVRGNLSVPGFMQVDDEDDRRALPGSTTANNSHYKEEVFDEDEPAEEKTAEEDVTDHKIERNLNNNDDDVDWDQD
jgi:hypothetical protein